MHLLVVAALFAAAPAGGPAEDVVAVEALWEVFRNQAEAETLDRRAVSAAVERALGRTLERWLIEAGLQLGHPDRASLHATLPQRVRDALAGVPDRPGEERESALEQLGRKVTTGAAARQVVDGWLGFDTETNPLPRVQHRYVQLRELEGNAGDLRLDAAATGLLGDEGGAGGGNGFIDPGEWVQLSIGIRNDSPRAWFSTTAFLEPFDGCTWVDRHHGYVLDELEPGEGTRLTPWAYVSAECSGGARGALRLRFEDTHHPNRPSNLLLAITPMQVGPPQLVNVRLDVDHLGSSDGSLAKRLSPGTSFEVVVDVEPGARDTEALLVRYHVPSDLRPLFSSFEHREAPYLPGPTAFAASDDLDAELVGQREYVEVLRGARDSARWVQGDGAGKLWLAVDVVMRVHTPTAEPAKEEPVRAPRLARASGTATRSVAPAAPAEAPQKESRPVTPEQLVELVRGHTHLVPHPVEPRRPGALHSASGYEVLFDKEGFLRDYRALTAVEVAPAATAAPTRWLVPYAHRRYLPLPLHRISHSPPPSPSPAPRPAPAAGAPAPSLVATAPSYLRVDVALQLALYGVSAPPDDPLHWGTSTSLLLPGISGRVAVGSSIVGLLGAGYSRREVVGSGPVSSVLLRGEGGVGYLLHVEQVELMPYATLDYRTRFINTADYWSWSVGLQLGGVGRYPLNDAVLATAGLALDIGAPGPYLDDVSLLSGFGAYFTAGISIRF